MGYGMCWVYGLLGDATNKIKEMTEDAVSGQPVNATVFSKDGFAELDAYYTSEDQWPYMKVGRFRSDYHRASMMFERDGVVKALPWAAEKVERWERILVEQGMIPREEAVASAPGGVHPVDKATGWVLNNRETYFGVVMAAMAAPAVPLLGEIANNVRKR